MSEKVDGICKWFSNEKGYGFLVAEGYNRDIFIHKQQMVKSGVKVLTENDKVSFTVNDGKKGLFATDITKVQENANRTY